MTKNFGKTPSGQMKQQTAADYQPNQPMQPPPGETQELRSGHESSVHSFHFGEDPNLNAEAYSSHFDESFNLKDEYDHQTHNSGCMEYFHQPYGERTSIITPPDSTFYAERPHLVHNNIGALVSENRILAFDPEGRPHVDHEAPSYTQEPCITHPNTDFDSGSQNTFKVTNNNPDVENSIFAPVPLSSINPNSICTICGEGKKHRGRATFEPCTERQDLLSFIPDAQSRFKPASNLSAASSITQPGSSPRFQWKEGSKDVEVDREVRNGPCCNYSLPRYNAFESQVNGPADQTPMSSLEGALLRQVENPALETCYSSQGSEDNAHTSEKSGGQATSNLNSVNPITEPEFPLNSGAGTIFPHSPHRPASKSAEPRPNKPRIPHSPANPPYSETTPSGSRAQAPTNNAPPNPPNLKRKYDIPMETFFCCPLCSAYNRAARSFSAKRYCASCQMSFGQDGYGKWGCEGRDPGEGEDT
ncbi:hypothetical protein NHQ30_004394 [Ciborinia camelliae]|nr:hypothetical protein NHQ30_004394 [Ciborinia camelliae]